MAPPHAAYNGLSRWHHPYSVSFFSTLPALSTSHPAQGLHCMPLPAAHSSPASRGGPPSSQHLLHMLKEAWLLRLHSICLASGGHRSHLPVLSNPPPGQRPGSSDPRRWWPASGPWQGTRRVERVCKEGGRVNGRVLGGWEWGQDGRAQLAATCRIWHLASIWSLQAQGKGGEGTRTLGSCTHLHRPLQGPSGPTGQTTLRLCPFKKFRLVMSRSIAHATLRHVGQAWATHVYNGPLPPTASACAQQHMCTTAAHFRPHHFRSHAHD